MMEKDPVYITGHRHPDTDSIASAIAYAFYKRATGVSAVPCRLGDINEETSYLLERFHFDVPELLEDARKKLSEIDIDPPIQISPDATLFETITRMKETGVSSLAVVDTSNRVLGMVSRSDLAMLMLTDTAEAIDLVSRTSVNAICRTVNGTLVYEAEKGHINGKISIIAMSSGKLTNYEITDRIVIVGNDPESMKELIRKGAGMLLAVWTTEIPEEVVVCAKEHNCSLVISGHGSMNTSRFIYFAPSVSLIMTKNPICFGIDDLAETVGSKLLQTRFRRYPILYNDGSLAGYVTRYHIMNTQNKRIILVDHNEFKQSVRAVEKAQLLEVIDHHRINDFMTSRPVSFRSEIIGSTATIIATIFRENRIPIPGNLAGLMLGAVLSDTMNFHSPTTTQKDRDNAYILAALADLDIEAFAKELFAVQSVDPLSESLDSILENDCKFYEIGMRRVMISQAIVTDCEEVVKAAGKLEEELEDYISRHHTDVVVMAFTSVFRNGSVFFTGGKEVDLAHEAFSGKDETHEFMAGILSRKKQILPMLEEAADRIN